MDVVYDFIESIHVFIPIIAVVVLVIIVYFAGTTGKAAQPPDDYIEKLKQLDKTRKQKPAAAPSKPIKTLPTGTNSFKDSSASPLVSKPATSGRSSEEKDEEREPEMSVRQRKAKQSDVRESAKREGKKERTSSEELDVPQNEGQWTTVTPKKRGGKQQPSSADKENVPAEVFVGEKSSPDKTPEKEFQTFEREPEAPSFGEEDENWKKQSQTTESVQKSSPKKGKKAQKEERKKTAESPVQKAQEVPHDDSANQQRFLDSPEVESPPTPTPPAEEEGWQTQQPKSKKKHKKKSSDELSPEGATSAGLDLYQEAGIEPPPNLAAGQELKIGTDDQMFEWSSSATTNTDSSSPKQAQDSSSTSAVLVSELSEQQNLEEVEEEGVVVVKRTDSQSGLEEDEEGVWKTQDEKKKKKRRKKKGKKDPAKDNVEPSDEGDDLEDVPWETETGQSLSADDHLDCSPSSNQRKRRPRRE